MPRWLRRCFTRPAARTSSVTPTAGCGAETGNDAPAPVRSLIAFEPMLFRWLDGDGPWDVRRREFSPAANRPGACCSRRRAGAAQRFVDFCPAPHLGQPARRQQSAIAGRMRAVHAHFVALINEPARAGDRATADADAVSHGCGDRPGGAPHRRAAATALPSSEHQVLDGMGHMGRSRTRRPSTCGSCVPAFTDRRRSRCAADSQGGLNRRARAARALNLPALSHARAASGSARKRS